MVTLRKLRQALSKDNNKKPKKPAAKSYAQADTSMNGAISEIFAFAAQHGYSDFE